MMKVLNEWLGFFHPLRVRNLQIFWSGQVIALIGMWLQVTAMGILAYRLSGGSGTAVGVLAALNAVPFLTAGMLLGGLGDRFDRCRLLIVVQCVQVLLSFGLFVLTWTGVLELWHLYLVGLLVGVNQTIIFPTQQAFVGDLIPKNQLQEAVGMYSLMFNTCRSVGPALAGYVIAEYGPEMAFGLNTPALMPLVGCLVVLKGRIGQRSAAVSKRAGGRRISGLQTAWQTKSILFILLSALIQNVFGQALYQIVPALMLGSPRDTGLILGSVGAGAVVSLLFVMPFVRKNNRIGAKLSVGTLWMGCAFFVSGLVPVVYVQSVCFFLAGLATSALFVTSSAAVQLLAPLEKRSSILGLFSIVTIGVQPLAALGWGAMIDVTGVPMTLMAAGALEAAFSLKMLSVPYWREFRFSPDEG